LDDVAVRDVSGSHSNQRWSVWPFECGSVDETLIGGAAGEIQSALRSASGCESDEPRGVTLDASPIEDGLDIHGEPTDLRILSRGQEIPA